jgi:pimeloyl-ACP methyl ester carboxylesterase
VGVWPSLRALRQRSVGGKIALRPQQAVGLGIVMDLRRSGLPTCLILALMVAPAGAQTATVRLSGKPQTVYVYRPDHAISVVILSSGDLGWAGLVVDVAEFLKSQQVAVLGLDAKAYLESFTSGKSAVSPEQIPGDYEVLAREAARLLGTGSPPVLVGVSEGAGLSVVAAARTDRRDAFSGVVGLGLPDSVELGWRAWRDWTIWITKGSPDEPHLSVMDCIAKVTPTPLAIIQSSTDEFVPLETAKALFATARDPKRIFFIDAANHRFSDKRPEVYARLQEALEWIARERR